MAIALAFSSSEAFDTLAEDGKEDSTFLTVIGNFFHFVLIQTIAIIIAVVATQCTSSVLSALGFFFFLYAILTGVAISGQLLMTAQVFNAVAGARARRRSKEEK